MTNSPLYHFEEFNEQIYAAQAAEGLQNISTVQFEGKTSVEFFSAVLRKKKSLFPLPYSDFKIHDELDFITKDIKYFTGVLYFLKPYIVDTSRTRGMYRQNLADHRYLTYASSCVQAIYNYWDRIGDLLHLYFKTGLKPDKVYLGMVINNFPVAYKQEPEYIALKELYDNNLNEFLNERNQVVHYYQLETLYYWGAIENHRNPAEAARLNLEKLTLPDKFKHHLQLAIRGFELALKLIDKLPDGVFVRIKRTPRGGMEPFKVHFAEVILGEDLTKLFSSGRMYTKAEADLLIARMLDVDASRIALYDAQDEP